MKFKTDIYIYKGFFVNCIFLECFLKQSNFNFLRPVRVRLMQFSN